VTQALNPTTQARWTLGDLDTYLCAWADAVDDPIGHSVREHSPRDACRRGKRCG